MSCAPRGRIADRRGGATLTGDERRYRREVVRLEGVTHPIREAEQAGYRGDEYGYVMV